MQEKVNILNELREAGASVLLQADNNNHYYLPADYFTNLSDNVLAYVYVYSLPIIMPYAVPERYFDNLPETILEKLSISLISKEIPYNVPGGYFDALPGAILSKIRASEVHSELEEISPLLSSLSKTNVYSVPEDYFTTTNPVNTVNKADKENAKVVSMFAKNRNWMQYAVAACFAALLFGVGYLYFFRSKPIVTAEASSADIQKQISSLSDDEIAGYLKDNNNVAIYTSAESDDPQLQNTDIQNLLENVSDEEIQQYLQDNPESKKVGGGI